MKCNYCGKTEVCKGAYPEGCFLEHQIAKIDYKKLLLEFMIRTHHLPPTNEEEETWFNEGLNARKNPKLLQRFIGAVC
jgi:hypothetical protein